MVMRVQDRFHGVEIEHRKNQEKGKVQNVLSNSRRLLEYKTVQWVSDIWKSIEKMGRESVIMLPSGAPPDGQ
jgi:hypothetical protein